MRLFAILLGLWVLTAQADEEPAPTMSLTIEAGGRVHRLIVEVADTDARRQRGLMERDSLAEGTGMLFVYPRPQSPRSGFWMYRTRISLDVAFLAEDGRILAIRGMEPCPHEEPGDCPVYLAGIAYPAALETPRGWFAARGIGVGERVRFGPRRR